MYCCPSDQETRHIKIHLSFGALNLVILQTYSTPNPNNAGNIVDGLSIRLMYLPHNTTPPDIEPPGINLETVICAVPQSGLAV
jgi:hypothetical protein